MKVFGNPKGEIYDERVVSQYFNGKINKKNRFWHDKSLIFRFFGSNISKCKNVICRSTQADGQIILYVGEKIVNLYSEMGGGMLYVASSARIRERCNPGLGNMNYKNNIKRTSI